MGLKADTFRHPRYSLGFVSCHGLNTFQVNMVLKNISIFFMLGNMTETTLQRYPKASKGEEKLMLVTDFPIKNNIISFFVNCTMYILLQISSYAPVHQ